MIEIDTGPSELEKRIEAYREKETGDIILSPEKAKSELLRSLLSFFRAVSRASGSRRNSTVEVLAQIAEAEGERFNFTKAKEKFEKEQAEKERNAREKEETLGVLLPRTPPVPEI